MTVPTVAISQAKTERIEIATRLMEAWFKGPSASIDPAVFKAMTERCWRAAREIQTEA